jgi:anti-sigma factor RsiW
LESLVEISLVFPDHPSEEVLEEYSFGRLSGQNLDAVEEHLLVCGACQATLAETEQYIHLVKAATSQPVLPKRGVPVRLRTMFPGPARAWAGAGVMAFGLLLGSFSLTRTFSAPTAVVRLQSYRGGNALRGDGATQNRAPASRPLDFRIRAEDVPRAPKYRLEVVTSNGRTIWTGAVQVTQTELAAHLEKRLPAGLYWVRLYAKEPELLMEYGLRLE